MGLSRRKRIARFQLVTGISLEGELVRRGAEYTVVSARQEVPAAGGKPASWADLDGVQRIPRSSVAYYTLLLG